jgi:competence protein ComEC
MRCSHAARMILCLAFSACARPPPPSSAVALASPAPSSVALAPKAGCGAGKRLKVHFYDVGEGLAALVDLPDGRHVLVDTGNSPRRPGCDMCSVEDEHLLRRMSIDLGQAPIDVVWTTHQKSDDLGGAPGVLSTFKVGSYVDNGRDLEEPEVQKARAVAQERGVAVHVVDPDHRSSPIADSADVKFRAVLPAVWPLACARNPDECSVGLRIDFCASSVLFTGDAEHEEEAVVDPGGPVTLLQVAHHGSETATTVDFLAQAKPKYAVISAGKPGDGPNRNLCVPRVHVIERLNAALGGSTTASLLAFAGGRCERAKESSWVSVPASDRLWATERDGDVVLSTSGDGTFARE